MIDGYTLSRPQPDSVPPLQRERTDTDDGPAASLNNYQFMGVSVDQGPSEGILSSARSLVSVLTWASWSLRFDFDTPQ